MSETTGRNKLEETIALLMSDFFNTFNYEPFPMSVSFTNDLWGTYFSLRPDHKSKFTGQHMPDFNGMVVPPSELDGMYTILINIQYLLEEIEKGCFAWVGTIIHEANMLRTIFNMPN